MSATPGRIRSLSDAPSYRFKKKIAEDERTETFLVEDLELGREVHLVRVRKEMGEVVQREFLLRARYLGQLQHPGILPVYDMGVINETCYYTYRKPPAGPLGQALKAKDRHLLRYMRSSGFRLQLLISIIDTIAYAHGEGVSVGKLNFDSIMVGPHGENIVFDWSSSRWVSKARQEKGETAEKPALPEEWMRNDMKELAKLGMNLMGYWNYGNPSEQMSIQEWDWRAKYLPADLQIIFDRAFLERHADPYRDLKEFQKDLLNHLNGYPLDLLKGDFLIHLQSLYRRNRKASNLFMIFCIAGLILLMSVHLKIRKSESDISHMTGQSQEIGEKSENLTRREKDLEDRGAELSRLKVDALKRLEEKAAARRATDVKIASARSGLEALSGNIQTLKEQWEQADAEMKISMDRSSEIETQRKKMEDRRDSLETKEQEWVSEYDDSYFLDEFLKAADGSQQQWVMRDYMEAAQKLLKGGWMLDYLRGRADGGSVSVIPLAVKQFSPPAAISADGMFLAWISAGSTLHLYSRELPDKLVSLPLKYKISKPVFSIRRNVLHGSCGTNKLALILLNEKFSEASCRLSVWNWKPKTWGRPLPYSPPTEIRTLSNNTLYYQSFDEALFEERPNGIKLDSVRNEIVEVQVSPRGDAFACKDSRGEVHLLRPFSKGKPRSLSRPQKELWGFMIPGGGIYFCSQNRLSVFDGENQNQTMSFELRSPPQVILAVPDSSRFWMRSPDGTVSCLDMARDISVPVLRSRIDAVPLYAVDHRLLLCDKNDSVLEADFSPDEKHLVELKEEIRKTPSRMMQFVKENQLLMEAEKGPPRKITASANIIDAVCPEEKEPFIIILSGPRNVEVWDSWKNRRVLKAGFSGDDLERVYYSVKEHRPVTLDKKGELRFW